MKRTIILAIGWVVACFTLFTALMLINLALNFFDWQPRWDWRIPIFGVGVLASTGAIWFLARATRDRFSLIASLIVCLVLLGFAICILPAEQTDKSEGTGLLAGLFVRHSASPFWFRSSIAAFMALPTVFWFGWLLKHRRYSPPHTALEPTAL